MNWASRSAVNILPLSIDQKNLSLALKEWIYTGEMYDLEAANETCQLCDHPNIRYKFNIRNAHNHNELLVGSECINKFEIRAVDESGALLNVIESRRKVNRDKRHLVSEASKKRLINALVELLKKDEEFEIENFINYVQDRGAFTPLQLSILVWRLKVSFKQKLIFIQIKIKNIWKISQIVHFSFPKNGFTSEHYFGK